MKLKYKRVLSILLVIIVMLTIVSPIMQTPAEAVGNPAIALEAVELVIWVLGLLGITFAATGDQYRASQQAYSDIPELKLWVDNNTQNVNPTTHQMMLSKNALADLATKVIGSVKAYFSESKTSVNVADYTTLIYDSIKVTDISKCNSEMSYYYACPYSSSDTKTLTLNGVVYVYSMKLAMYQTRWYEMLLNGDTCMNAQGPLIITESNTDYNLDYRWGLYLYDGGTVKKLVPYVAMRMINKNNGYTEYKYMLGHPSLHGNFEMTKSLSFGNLATNYGYPIEYSDEELKQAINSAAAALPVDGSVSIPLDDPNWDATHGKTEVENPETAVPAVPTTNWAEIWDKLGIKDLIKTLTENKSITLNESEFKAPQLPASIIDKFPFCVPFDLIAIVQTLNAPPVAPSFTIPMRFDSINYTENFTIDLSGNDWNRVGKVIRWGNTLLFLAGLILITRKVIQA